jgi:hypothetical protein
VDTDLYGFVQRLLEAIHHPVFKEGTWQLCECSGWSDNGSFQNLLAWCWSDDDERYLVVVNYSAQPSQGRIRVPGYDLYGSNWRLNDVITGITFERNGGEMHDPGLYVALGAWQTHFLRFYLM